MKQQIEVTLTLWADASLSKEQIKKKIEDMINFATLHSTTHDRMLIPEINLTSIKEEAEIYNND